MGAYTESQQAQFNRSQISCGVTEMHHLPKLSPSQTAFQLATNLYHKANPRPAAFIVFSDVIKENSRGDALAKFLMQYGAVLTSSVQVNPRTGNPICLWVFTPDHDKFRAFFVEGTMNFIRE